MGVNDIRAALRWQGRAGQSASPSNTSAQETLKMPRIRPLPWRQITRDAVGIFLVTRLAYAIVTYFAVTFSINVVRGSTKPAPLQTLLQSWQTGDVGDYLTIASQGYVHNWLTAFFPLYPLLVHIFSFGQTGTFQLAVAMVISNLGTLAALIGLGLLAAHENGPLTAMPTIRALVAFPLAFFLVMGYADNLFLALVVFAFFFARRSVWGGAIACTFVGALLRPTAITLTLPLLWEYGRQQGWWAALWLMVQQRRIALWTTTAQARSQALAKRIAYPLLLLAAAPAGVAIFAVYCWAVFGDALVFLHVQQSYFVRRPTSLPRALLYLLQTLHGRQLSGFLEARNLIDLAPFVLFLGIVVYAGVRRQMSVMYVIYMLSIFYADLAAPMVGREIPFPSVGRHMLLAAPVFLLLGKWSTKRPWLDTLILSVGLTLQGVLLVAVMYGNLTHFNAID